MKKGYWVAIVGLLVFVASVFVGAGFELEGDPATLLIAGAFLFLGMALWVGTAIVAVEKGYHLIVGTILGAFAPGGLLVVTLMPDRSAKGHRAGTEPGSVV